MGDVEEVPDEWRNDPDRPAVYERTDGMAIYRASALGQCMGNLVRVRLGMDPDLPPDWLEAAFEWGTEAEPETLRWLTTQGFKLLDGWELESQFAGHRFHDGQVETELAVGTSSLITCHPDGIGDRFLAGVTDSDLPTGTRVVVEAKRLSNSWAYDVIGKPENLPPYYKYQVAIEMLSTGLPCVFVVAVSDKETHEIVDRQWFPIMEPPVSLNAIKLRVMKIETAASRQTIPECEYAQYPCGFWRDHNVEQGVWLAAGLKSASQKAGEREKAGKAVRAKDVGIDEDELDGLILEYVTVDYVIKHEAPNHKRQIQDKIEALLDAAGVTGKRIHTAKHDLNDVVVTDKGRMGWKEYAISLGGNEKGDDKFRGESTDKRYPKIQDIKGKDEEDGGTE